MRVTDPVFREQHLLYSINGSSKANLPLLTMKPGQHVRWYLMANSNEDDVHTVHWHGQTALFNHMRTDTVPLSPMGMAVVDMVPDKEGTWLLHCHVNDHLMGGMIALSKLPADKSSDSSPAITDRHQWTVARVTITRLLASNLAWLPVAKYFLYPNNSIPS